MHAAFSLLWQRKLRDNEVARLLVSALFGVMVAIGAVAIERLVQ